MNKLIVAAIRCSLMLLLPAVAYPDSAQWDLNPSSDDWNTDANWTPMTVPNGSTDIATFALSNTTNVSISANTEVNGITFTAAATNPYIITASAPFTLRISGTGITNNSGSTQHFMTAQPQLPLRSSPTAGLAAGKVGRFSLTRSPLAAHRGSSFSATAAWTSAPT